MSFISIEFVVFFFVTVGLCRQLPHVWQNRLLLVASYFFYGWWDWRFLGLILFSSAVDFACALSLARTRKKSVLFLSIATNLALLGFFKYYGFFVESLEMALKGLDVSFHFGSLDIILPVGISFYTFQSMSYSIDVYRGHVEPTKRLEDFLLYVAFFPQLVAGPIERATRLLPQIEKPRTISAAGVADGIQLMLFGFFKKMVVADNLAVYVNSVYESGTAPDGLSVVLATYAFAFQIYADFSGYTDIARGAARTLGFDLCRNFKIPYLATSPSDFWQRWHISLSTWLRDYLYIPLGGNRRGRFLTFRNLLVTMLLGGLWHGAAGNFVLWGAYHGLLLIVFHAFMSRASAREAGQRIRSGPVFWCKVFAFFQLTSVGWLLFRVPDMAKLGELVSAIGNIGKASLHGPALLLVLVFALPLFLFDIVRYRTGQPEPWRRWSVAGQTAFFVLLFYGIALLGAPHGTTFIYFQF